MINMDMANIMKKLNDPDPEQRRQIIESVQPDQLNDALLRILVHKLEDENKGVRDAAFQVLSKCKNELLPRLLVPFFYYRDLEVKNLAVDIMVQLGELAVPELIEILDTSDPDAQKSAAEVINIIKSHQAVDALLRHLDDPDPNVAFASIEALGSIGDLKAIQPLIKVFKESEDLRGVAIEAIGKILSHSIPDELLKALNEDDPLVVFSVVEALGKIKAPIALEKLLEIYPYHDELLKQEILKSISNIISSSKFFMVPGYLLEDILNYYQEAGFEEKKIYLRLLSRIPDGQSLDILLNAYSISDEQKWQECVFENLVNYFLLFPDVVKSVIEQNDDLEYQMYLFSHMPYTGLPEYFTFLENIYKNYQKDELGETALFYLLQFNLPEAKAKIEEILRDNTSSEHGVLIEFFKDNEINPYLDIVVAHIAQYPQDIAKQYIDIMVSQEIEGLYEKLESIMKDIPDGARIKLLRTKEELSDQDVNYICGFLNSGNEELNLQILDILLHVPHQTYPKEIENLVECESWQVHSSLARLFTENYVDKIPKIMPKIVTKKEILSAFLHEMQEKQVELSLEIWKQLLSKASEEAKEEIIKYLLQQNEEKMNLALQELNSWDKNQIQNFLDDLVDNEQYELLQLVLNNCHLPEEIEKHFSQFLQA